VPAPLASLAARRVPLLDLHPIHDPLRDEILSAVARVFSSQQFILGPDVAAFEEELATMFSTGHCIGCASGSDALLLALLAAGIGRGDQVVVPSFTFFATAGAVTHAGAEPVFCDIDPVTLNLDPAFLESLVRTHPRIKAVIPVHLYGGAADMDPILRLAGTHGWTVIEDSAQSIGATYRYRSCLSLGHMSALSFFPTKNLGALGDAGAVTTGDVEVAARLRALRVHGSQVKYHHEWVGVNARLDSLQAAILRVKLPHLARWAAARQANAALYLGLFAQWEPPITVPQLAGYQTNHVWNQFVIRSSRRDELREFLARQGIGTEVYYPTPLHLQPCFRHLAYREGDLPQSEKASREALALPIHPGLAEDDICYVVQQIRAFHES
jgi:dTDP-4-amino-4,6-dideoxygalactose transaminase